MATLPEAHCSETAQPHRKRQRKIDGGEGMRSVNSSTIRFDWVGSIEDEFDRISAQFKEELKANSAGIKSAEAQLRHLQKDLRETEAMLKSRTLELAETTSHLATAKLELAELPTGTNDVCVLCKKSFSTRSGLIKHLQKQHAAKMMTPLLCDCCNHEFKRSTDLSRHLNAKSKDKPDFRIAPIEVPDTSDATQDTPLRSSRSGQYCPPWDTYNNIWPGMEHNASPFDIEHPYAFQTT